MITKAIIQSITADGTRCIVRMPLFETLANPNPVEAEALINITPGVFNNLEIGDVVFIAFEENAIEMPIIIGKLFRGADIENEVPGGGAIFDSLKVHSTATIPSSTLYKFPDSISNKYKDLSTPKKTADYIKWLESYTKSTFDQLEDHFKCFKNWTQWQFKPENVEIDDGDLDSITKIPQPFLYQAEGDACAICKVCTKGKKRNYPSLPLNKEYSKGGS